MYKTKTLTFEKRCARATTATEISGECDIPNGQPGILQVLDCPGAGGCSAGFWRRRPPVRGRRAQDFHRLCHQQPANAHCAELCPDPVFRNVTRTPGAAQDQHVTAMVKVKDLYANGSEDGGTIEIRAVCAIELEAQQSMEIEVVEDAYALSCETQGAVENGTDEPVCRQLYRCGGGS